MAELDAPLGVVSYHVRRLVALGLLKPVKRVPRRGAVEHYYTAKSRPRITSAAWGRTPGIVKQATVRAAVDQIGHYVGTAATTGGFDAAESHLTRVPLTVDRKGWSALADELDALHERVKKIESDSIRRLSRTDHEGEQEATVVLMLFNSPSEDPPGHGSKRTSAGMSTAHRSYDRG
jgi:hypothetical protein